MQYLGSQRKVAAFSGGMAAGVFAFVLFEGASEIRGVLPDAVVAATTMFAGTLVGTLVWSSIGGWLKTRPAPPVLVCAGIGAVLAVAFAGAFAMVVHTYWGILLGEPLGTLHDVGFWLAIALWNSIGYGLAVSPAVGVETTSASNQPT